MEFPQHFSRYGQGNYIRSLPQKETLDFMDFSRGYFAAGARETAPDGFVPYAMDIEITNNNRAKRAPGTLLLESFLTRTPERFALHGSLDFSTELVLFDAPFVGVKSSGLTEWADVSLHTGPFAWTNFGGTFIFTDGHRVFSRQPNEGATATELEGAPVARTYASWAGRVWAGHALIGGNLEPMGLMWSAANSDYRDWEGIGAGFELLINEIASGDQILALKPMNLNFMAIMLRNSVWIASFTGLRDRPGSAEVRVSGSGTVNGRTCHTTRFGVIYLSDSGVYIFDGNNSSHISEAIDAELLPLDYASMASYSATYDPTSKRYYLHTPTQTWVYEIERQRWMPRSLVVLESVVWPDQIPFEQWADLVGDWSNQGETLWAEYAGGNEPSADMLFLGEQNNLRALAKEAESSSTYFGEAFTPILELRPVQQQHINKLLTMKQFNIEYVGGGDLELWAPNLAGTYEKLVDVSLALLADQDVKAVYETKTGRIAGMQLRLGEGDPEFIHLQVVTQQRGPRVEVDTAYVPSGPVGSLTGGTRDGDKIVFEGDGFLTNIGDDLLELSVLLIGGGGGVGGNGGLATGVGGGGGAGGVLEALKVRIQPGESIPVTIGGGGLVGDSGGDTVFWADPFGFALDPLVDPAPSTLRAIGGGGGGSGDNEGLSGGSGGGAGSAGVNSGARTGGIGSQGGNGGTGAGLGATGGGTANGAGGGGGSFASNGADASASPPTPGGGGPQAVIAGWSITTGSGGSGWGKQQTGQAPDTFDTIYGPPRVPGYGAGGGGDVPGDASGLDGALIVKDVVQPILARTSTGLLARHEYDDALYPFVAADWVGSYDWKLLTGGVMRFNVPTAGFIRYVPVEVSEMFVQAQLTTQAIGTLALLGVFDPAITEGIAAFISTGTDPNDRRIREYVAGVGATLNSTAIKWPTSTSARMSFMVTAAQAELYDFHNASGDGPVAHTNFGTGHPGVFGVLGSPNTFDVQRFFVMNGRNLTVSGLAGHTIKVKNAADAVVAEATDAGSGSVVIDLLDVAMPAFKLEIYNGAVLLGEVEPVGGAWGGDVFVANP